jgi:recombination associated protein RdgC
VAALARKKKNARDLSPTSFSERLEDALAGGGLGEDFLTWLWFCSEERGGAAGDEGGFTFGLDGPLTLVMEGEGAHVVMMRKGVPLLSTEAKAALTAGKKLASAVLLAARGELSWRVTLDARAFVFRGVKLPEGERLDAISLFQQRMVALDALREGVLAAFDAFVEERFDPAEWRRTRNAMRRWVAGRAERF